MPYKYINRICYRARKQESTFSSREIREKALFYRKQKNICLALTAISNYLLFEERKTLLEFWRDEYKKDRAISPRLFQILVLCGKGFFNWEVANILGLSQRSVECNKEKGLYSSLICYKDRIVPVKKP